MTNILVCWCKSSVAENLRSPTILCSKHKHLNFVRSLQTMGVVFYLGEKAVFRKTSDTNVTLLFLSYNFGNNVVSTNAKGQGTERELNVSVSLGSWAVA